MASKLNKRELAVRTFILEVFKKEITITSRVFAKVVKTFADVRNKEIVEKYGDRIYSSMLAVYKFKNHQDYSMKLDMLKQSAYLDSGLTQYGHNHSIITKKLFDSEFVKTDWIIEDMGNQGSLAEINNIVVHLFRRERDNLSVLLDQVLQITQYTKNEKTVASTIIRNILYDTKFKDTDLLQSIFNREFGKADTDTIRSVEVYFKASHAHKTILEVTKQWLYSVTKKDEYLPEDAKEMFLF